jgi:spermidine synthase
LDAASARSTLRGLSALSLSAILFEIALTRVSSVLLYTYLTTVVIAACLAAVGVGAGWTRRRLSRDPAAGALILARSASRAAGSALLALVALVTSPAGFYLCLFAVPFFFFGAYAGAAYALAGRRRLTYAADLSGGAAGAFLASALLRRMGDVDTALLAVALMGLTAVLLGSRLGPKRAPLWLVGVPLAVLASNALLPSPLLSIDPFSDFGFQPHLLRQTRDRGGRILATAYDAYARTDLVSTNEAWVRYLFTDRMHTARIVRWDGRSSRFGDAEAERLARLKGLVFRALAPARVLVLGAGGGFDVALALQAGADRVDAVEINPAMIRFTRRLGAFSGNVYDRPEVCVHEGEARRFVRGAKDFWDVISLSLLQTDPATMRASTGYQSWVFTVEAVGEYLARLPPGGVLAIVQNTETLERKTVATVVESFASRGLGTSTALGRIAVIALPEDESNPFARLVVVGRDPLSPAQCVALGRAARETEAQVRQLPGFPGSYVSSGAGGWRQGEWIARDPHRLDPPSDDAPFFFEVHRALPLLHVITAAAAAILLLVALVRERRAPDGVQMAGVLAASALGGGFMMFQSASIGRGQFLLGHPALAVAVVVGGTLLAAGCGSLLSETLATRGPRTCLVLGALAVVLAAVAQRALWPAVVAATQGAGTALLVGTVIALVASLALPAGFCFPACLDLWAREAVGSAGLYTANALASVIGASAATLLAMTHGFSTVFMAAACCYGVAGALALGHPSARSQ